MRRLEKSFGLGYTETEMKISIAGIAIEHGNIFIAKRLPGGEMGGKWEFPGGKVERNESGEETIVREFLEEFGVRVRCGDFLGESSFVHNNTKRILKAYRIYFSDYDFILNEHSEWRWVRADEIPCLDFTPSDLTLLPFIEPVVLID
jgi:8-oxo-dGTP diphosphatase